MNLRLLALASLLMASLLTLGCINQGNNSAEQPTVITAPKEIVTVQFLVKGQQNLVGKTISVEKGSNAFEEMKKLFDVNYAQYAFGPMVTAINGESAPQGSYWALYVDGNYSSLGINAITMDKNMEISWRLEEIKTS